MLRDQSVIAGIGNAYSDEVLHVAKMSPYKLAASLTEEEVATLLYEAIMTTLGDAVERSRGPGGQGPQGREEVRACACTAGRGRSARSAATRSVRCRSPTRALQYCPTCQTGGKPLADRRMSRLLK